MDSLRRVLPVWLLNVACLAGILLSGPGAHADPAPSQTIEVWYDAQGHAFPENPGLAGKQFVEGDTIKIIIDPARFFPNAPVAAGQLAVGHASVPPQLHAFPLAYTSVGVAERVWLQPGLCVLDEAIAKAKAELAQAKADAKPQKDIDQLDANLKAADAALASARANSEGYYEPPNDAYPIKATGGELRCEPSDFKWPLQAPGNEPYTCGDGRRLDDLIVRGRLTEWSLVQTFKNQAYCVRSWKVTVRAPLTGVVLSAGVGALAPETTNFSTEDERWVASLTLKPGTTRIGVRLDYTDGDGHISSKRFSLVASAFSRDEHSLVRVQGEVLTTNALRAVSFAVTVTPVSRSFFTKGPWRGSVDEAVILSGIAPIVVLRLGGEQRTFVQLGFGLGIYTSRALQLNGGFLFGTSDVATGWHPERAWFIGVALDPAILAEAGKVSPTGASSSSSN